MRMKIKEKKVFQLSRLLYTHCTSIHTRHIVKYSIESKHSSVNNVLNLFYFILVIIYFFTFILLHLLIYFIYTYLVTYLLTLLT